MKIRIGLHSFSTKLSRFFDPGSAKFPLAVDSEWNMARRAANWVPFLLLLPAVFALLRKLVFPSERTLIAPSIVLYLLGSFLIGPGLTSNLLLKGNWGRLRPNTFSSLPGPPAFQPWWWPGGSCRRTARSYRGRQAQAFWTVVPPASPRRKCGLSRTGAPWSLAPQSVFGRRLRAPFRHRYGVRRAHHNRHRHGALPASARSREAQRCEARARRRARLDRAAPVNRPCLGPGQALSQAGASLRSTGQHLRKRVACL
jgi:hypothetical protein